MNVYHSALRNELDITGHLDRYEMSGSIVFCHDITIGTAPEYRRADAIYSEPAWKDGYAKFIQRAGSTSDQSYSGYINYLHTIEQIIQDLKVPAYIVLGKHMLRFLSPDHVKPIKLHGEALLGTWFIDLPPHASNDDIIAYVADLYDCIVDFSCGYGNLAKAMNDRGKRFICSDINPKCVYYIAKTLMGYKDE